MLPVYTFGEAAVVFTVFGTVMLAFICLISWLVRPMPNRPNAGATYECGMRAQGENRALGFNFIGYATLFLVFDLAALYLFLYAVTTEIPLVVTISFTVGIATLVLLIYYGTQKRRYYVA